MKTEENAKKRDNIIKKIRLINNEEAEQKAIAIFNKFLLSAHKNRTPERINILSLIYRLTAPADMETIHQIVEEHYSHVSPTTVYYTLQLLVEAKLVNRLELIENGPAFFEKSLDNEPHGYSICRHCGIIKTIPLNNIKDEVSNKVAKGFHIDNISLTIFGTCKSCYKKLNSTTKKKQSKKTK